MSDWAYDFHPEQNEETLRYLASLYARSHPFMHLGNLKCTKKSGIVEKTLRLKENTAKITWQKNHMI